MIWQFVRGLMGDSDVDMVAMLVQMAALAVVLIFCLPVHEYAHGLAAKKLGDNTAWMHGRLTLNPAKHLDLLGTLMMLFVGIGYAKPVPVNPRNFKDYKKGMAITAAAGPLSNLILAFGFMLVYQILGAIVSLTGVLTASNVEMFSLIFNFFFYIAAFNVALMLFNLLPVPPLDGSRILDLILPARASAFIARYERYMFLLVIVVAFALSDVLSSLAYWILQGIDFLTGLPFLWVEAVI